MCLTVEFSRSLTARTGTARAHVGVREGDTLRDVVERLADEYGPQVETGLLDGDRLRSDTVATREGDGGSEPLSLASPVECGQTVRFELTSERKRSRVLA